MSDKLFTADERKEYEALAHQRGFQSLRDYMKALIARDVEQPNESDENLGDPAEGFRIAWGQAMRGETISEEEFWKAIANDE